MPVASNTGLKLQHLHVIAHATCWKGLQLLTVWRPEVLAKPRNSSHMKELLERLCTMPRHMVSVVSVIKGSMESYILIVGRLSQQRA